MPGLGMSCFDKTELCKLNCMMPAVGPGEEQSPDFNNDSILSCVGNCVVEDASCKEMPETSQYVDCGTACTKSYEAKLSVCTINTSDVKIGSYNQNLDACSNIASGEMDTCMKDCYFGEGSSRSRFQNWSPEREEGRKISAIVQEEWRSPFTREEVIYGSGRPTSKTHKAQEMAVVVEKTDSQSFVFQTVLMVLTLAAVVALFLKLSKRFSLSRGRSKGFSKRPIWKSYGSLNGTQRQAF